MAITPRIRIWLFPVLELGCFALAVGTAHSYPMLSFLAFLLACVALSFAVHVTFHECVHQGYSGGVPAEFAISVLMGLPVDGYRFHHFNHHEHANALHDYSTTWASGDAGPVPQKCWTYAITWPRQLLRAHTGAQAATAAGTASPDWVRRVRRQKLFLLAFHTSLALLSPALYLAYFALIYWGWVLIAVHNHGQHPPVAYGTERPTSYPSPLYNWLFCNNGLHFEHHHLPARPFDALVDAVEAPRVALPHLLAPLSAGMVKHG
jgi:fatty acid desaturase